MNGVELEMKFISLINKRNMLFLFLTIVGGGMVYTPLRDLLANPPRSEYYSHILLIPVVSGFFLFMGRKEIFSNLEYSYTTGIPLLAIGTLVYMFGWTGGQTLNQNDYASLMTFAVVLFWIGGFVLLYGTRAFRNALFPLLFLVFMIPIPSILMEKTISVLLTGSTAATHMLFKLTGIPFLKEGAVFRLPGMSIELAKECSGIRSSLGLFITGILAGHLFLRTGWKKFALVLFVYPITVLKNGIRILTLSSLAVYVDERFITQSFLHKSGGFLFYIPALCLLAIVLWALRKTEKKLGDVVYPLTQKATVFETVDECVEGNPPKPCA
jgi:exosortase